MPYNQMLRQGWDKPFVHDLIEIYLDSDLSWQFPGNHLVHGDGRQPLQPQPSAPSGDSPQ